MRNQSGELLRRVADGESVVITDNGTPAAVLVPAAASPQARLAAAGRLSPQRGTGLDLSLLPAPRPCRTATQDLLDADRGQ